MYLFAGRIVPQRSFRCSTVARPVTNSSPPNHAFVKDLMQSMIHQLLCRVLLSSLFAIVLTNQATSVLAEDSRTPNVVVIFIDDMGYADIGPFGAEDYPTPNLDRMAAEGRRFTDFVVSSAVCSASRSALLTGCYHTRLGINGALGPKSDIGISDQEVTLAELCKSKGYATAMFGKWHLGHHPKFLPTQHGFDQYYGIPYSNDMWPLHPNSIAKRAKNPKAKINWPALPMIQSSADGYEIVNADVQPDDQALMTKQFTERAVGFIEQNKNNPFFVYLPHPMVHVPLYASEDFKGKSGAGIFGDVVMEVDWSVGQIMDVLARTGNAENTLLVFTSDNGPWLSYGDHAGSAGPFREGKGTMFEGGYREPTLMWWKGKIPAGTVCDTLCSSIDIVPTIAKLIDAPLPSETDADHVVDGEDIRPLMFGDPDAKSPHDAFYCYYGGGQLQAVRNERFKLVFPHKYRTLDGGPGGTDGTPVPYRSAMASMALYDLDNDVAENKNVMEDFPEVVTQLTAAAETARADLGDKLTKTKGDGVRGPGRMQPSDERLPQDWK